MKKSDHLSLILFISLSFFINTNLSAQTKMMTQPTLSANHIAFIYGEDLWVSDLNGKNPRRLTVSTGVEFNPSFSPDGKWIAFSGQYDGNIDVYKIPVEGGIPTRMTWHPGPDWTKGFTPDGKNILFASQRSVFTRRYAQFFTIPINGGPIEQLLIPHGWQASYSPKGDYMAYTPKREVFHQWKNYRGGTTSNIWIFSFKDYQVVEIPQPKEFSNDTDPIWINNKVYFRSDRNGEFNLYSYDITSKKVEQLTDYKDFPILKCAGGNNQIVFEQGGTLHIFNPANGTTIDVNIDIKADLIELREHYVSGSQHIRSASLSPSGKRVVFDYRGDIISLPAKKGDAKNITQTPGDHERNPSWSPDGNKIAYFSDASGEYELHIQPKDGKAKSYSISGNGFYTDINWAPDSKQLCFVDNSRTLYWFNMETGAVKTIDADDLYGPGPFRNLFGDWSADSKWLLYTKITETNYEKIFLYSVDQNKSYPITDGLSNASSPVFDQEGKYIYFFASTDAGPVINWFAQSNNDMEFSNAIYVATLQKETMNPFFKENDEEEGDSQKEMEEEKEKDNTTRKWTIDLDGIENRIVDIPVESGMYWNLGVNKSGELLYMAGSYNNVRPSHLRKYDFTKREDTKVVEANNYMLSANGEKMMYWQNGNYTISAAGQAPENGKGMLDLSSLEVKVNPTLEWENIFEESWRINRDYFYDPGMHGADWPAMKKKYKPFLKHLSCRSDLNRVIQWMCSELGVGHHRFSDPGNRLNRPDRVGGGLLGVDYMVANDRYKFKKIYGGLNWNPKMRSPLTEPGVNIKEGEYLLAINGQDLKADQNLFSFFEKTADKIVELRVGPNPNNTGSRLVKVVPVDNEGELRNRDWVEGNLKKVHQATEGKVAYVYVPNTANAGHEYFKRYFFPQANKDAIIVDERFNGGGQIADYYIDILLRPYQSYWNFRYGKDLKTPSASIQGPKVMLIDENAGSGGDMLPWMFRKFEVGTLIGKRTWGGLVGILGFPEFIDGGTVTAPNVAIWTKDGFIVENVGVAPDIEVEQLPVDIINGKDPQLDRAIEEILKQLKENPPIKPKRPDYPIRVRK